MTARVLEQVAAIIDRAPASRRAVLELIREDPQRVLDEAFETLAQRARSSVPTIMRTCRDLGYAGLREFKLALAQDLAVGGSPLNRRVRIDDNVRQGSTRSRAVPPPWSTACRRSSRPAPCRPPPMRW